MPELTYDIAKCRELIEKKLAWGKSDTWRSQDFETLSEKILEETKVMLSSTTLKRIWGKVSYESTPNMATLNALAQFAGYENWRVFTATDFQPLQEKTDVVRKPAFKIPFTILLFTGGFVLAIITITGFVSNKKHSKALRY